MKVTDSLTLLKLCCIALDDKKAEDLRVLDVREQSSITDYLVLVTATSETHLRALRVELEKVIDAAKFHLVGIETSQESGWTVVDAFDVMFHLFTKDARGHYRLETLWKDAKEVSTAKLFKQTQPMAKPLKRPEAKKRSPVVKRISKKRAP